MADSVNTASHFFLNQMIEILSIISNLSTFAVITGIQNILV